jgi:hypothetical protein
MRTLHPSVRDAREEREGGKLTDVVRRTDTQLGAGAPESCHVPFSLCAAANSLRDERQWQAGICLDGRESMRRRGRKRGREKTGKHAHPHPHAHAHERERMPRAL